MDPSPWLLSSDSLIVGGALATVVPRRHVAPLIALFGICDATASLCGPMLPMQVPASWFAPLVLILWGAGTLANLPAIVLNAGFSRCAYLLPPLLAVDNLLVPTPSPVSAGCTSSAMAAVGFALGLALLPWVNRGSLKPRLPGALLVAAGLSFAA